MYHSFSFFLHIPIPRNGTRTQTWLCYWFLILLNVNRLACLWMFGFFLFLLLTNFLKKKKKLYDSLVLPANNSFLFHFRSLISPCFLTLSIVFPKTVLFISLKKYFSNSCITFFSHLCIHISFYGFSWASWLNLMQKFFKYQFMI